jgi:hypothetical protein
VTVRVVVAAAVVVDAKSLVYWRCTNAAPLTVTPRLPGLTLAAFTPKVSAFAVPTGELAAPLAFNEIDPATLARASHPIATQLATLQLAPRPTATPFVPEHTLEDPSAVELTALAVDAIPKAVAFVFEAVEDGPMATAPALAAFAPLPAAILVAPELCATPLSQLQLAVPVPPPVLMQVKVPQPPFVGSTVIVFAPLLCTVTSPVLVFTILNIHPFARVVTTGNTTVCVVLPVKYCVCALVTVSVVVPAAVAVLA